jgi:hypothetical protein
MSVTTTETDATSLCVQGDALRLQDATVMQQQCSRNAVGGAPFFAAFRRVHNPMSGWGARVGLLTGFPCLCRRWRGPAAEMKA